MRPFTALLDAPDALNKPIQIAELGEFSDSRYGDFSITKDDVADWQKNLSQLPGGEALIDFEHRSERKPRDSRAAGWVSGLQLDGDKVMADVRWTPDGEKAVKDGTYRFISPAYGSHTNEHGVTFENTLMSVALTNKPALTGMPAVVLASEERVSEAAGDEIERLLDMQATGDEDALMLLETLTSKKRNSLPSSAFVFPADRRYPIHNASHARNALARSSGKSEEAAVKRAVYKRYPGLKPGSDNDADDADSRQHEMPTEALIKLLDLPQDADEATLLDAVEGLKAKAAKRAKKDAETKTLDQQAADEGKIVLDAAVWDKTQRQAKAGALAAKELHQQRFDTAFDKAVEQRKATPGEKDTLQLLYKADAETTLKMLDGRQAIMPDKPTGTPAIEFDPASPETFDAAAAARQGVNPDSVMLDAQIKKHLRDKDLPASEYTRVLDQFINEGLMLS